MIRIFLLHSERYNFPHVVLVSTCAAASCRSDCCPGVVHQLPTALFRSCGSVAWRTCGEREYTRKVHAGQNCTLSCMDATYIMHIRTLCCLYADQTPQLRSAHPLCLHGEKCSLPALNALAAINKPHIPQLQIWFVPTADGELTRIQVRRAGLK